MVQLRTRGKFLECKIAVIKIGKHTKFDRSYILRKDICLFYFLFEKNFKDTHSFRSSTSSFGPCNGLENFTH